MTCHAQFAKTPVPEGCPRPRALSGVELTSGAFVEFVAPEMKRTIAQDHRLARET